MSYIRVSRDKREAQREQRKAKDIASSCYLEAITEAKESKRTFKIYQNKGVLI